MYTGKQCVTKHVHKPHHDTQTHFHLYAHLSLDRSIYLYDILMYGYPPPKKKNKKKNYIADQSIQPFNDLNRPILHLQYGKLKKT